ncbi:MAG: hypothetical protein R3C14_34065 [Caldilineaceae bacterium]
MHTRPTHAQSHPFVLLVLFAFLFWQTPAVVQAGSQLWTPLTEGQGGADTAFTYQGELQDNSAPATGVYDLGFELYAQADGGVAVSNAPIYLQDQTVTDGLFTVELDFGAAVFDGAARYLAVSVRPGSSEGAYTVLTPRQKITPSPYSIHAQHSASAAALSTDSGASVLTVESGGNLRIGANHLPLVRIIRFRNIAENTNLSTGLSVNDYECVATGWSTQFDLAEVGPGQYMVWTYVVGTTWYVTVKFPSETDHELPDVDVLCFQKQIVSWEAGNEGATRGLWEPN